VANEQIFRTDSTGARHATAQAAITPGDLIEVIPTAGADLGKVRPHSTAAGRAAPLFADGNWQFGKGQDDAYAAGDTVSYRAPAPGEAVFARCASGTAITVGTPLESAGAGLLRVLTTGVTPGVAVAEALEAELASGDPTPGRILVRVIAQ
jgi:hypothetical protein